MHFVHENGSKSAVPRFKVLFFKTWPPEFVLDFAFPTTVKLQKNNAFPTKAKLQKNNAFPTKAKLQKKNPFPTKAKLQENYVGNTGKQNNRTLAEMEKVPIAVKYDMPWQQKQILLLSDWTNLHAEPEPDVL